MSRKPTGITYAQACHARLPRIRRERWEDGRFLAPHYYDHGRTYGLTATLHRPDAEPVDVEVHELAADTDTRDYRPC